MSYLSYIALTSGDGGGTPVPSDSAKNIDNLYIAGEDIAAFKFVAMGADGKIYMADINDESVQGRIIGITTAAVTAAGQGTVRQFGPITNAAWSFALDAPVHLGTDGNPTQADPPAGTFYAKVGYPLAATKLMIDIDQSVDI